LFLVIAIVAEIVLRKTAFGFRLIAVGSNPIAARLVGFHVERRTTETSSGGGSPTMHAPSASTAMTFMRRIVRRNDVVFEDGADEANSSVSRKHAHILRDGSDFRLVDDGSEYGTRVFRDGRSLEVPPGDRRGEKLRTGDEIYLGRACLRFER